MSSGDARVEGRPSRASGPSSSGARRWASPGRRGRGRCARTERCPSRAREARARNDGHTRPVGSASIARRDASLARTRGRGPASPRFAVAGEAAWPRCDADSSARRRPETRRWGTGDEMPASGRTPRTPRTRWRASPRPRASARFAGTDEAPSTRRARARHTDEATRTCHTPPPATLSSTRRIAWRS
jgi:hypothetical protein